MLRVHLSGVHIELAVISLVQDANGYQDSPHYEGAQQSFITNHPISFLLKLKAGFITACKI